MSLRNGSHLLRYTSSARNLLRQVPRQGLSTKQVRTSYAILRPLLIGGTSIVAAMGLFKYHKSISMQIPSVFAASTPIHQPSVISGTKEHALYLVIHINKKVSAKECAKVVANLPDLVDFVCPPDLRDENDEILAGVGFGHEFYTKSGGKPLKNYSYLARRGDLGDLPSTGGDIFIHAKSSSRSKLFELTQHIISQLPEGSITSYEDIYGWVYKNGRDLSGFIDGTENAADETDRYNIAVEKATGGSYVIAQKWIHRHDVINSEKDVTLSSWVGRSRDDSIELHNKSTTSHVARMTGGTNFEQKKTFQIVRQSQPYGSLSGESGLFFIAYAESPENFDFMLDRMVGRNDRHTDDIMRMTRCVKGTYFYFPGVAELENMKKV